MKDFLVGFLTRATEVFPVHAEVFSVLLDECKRDIIQFNISPYVESTISSLCSTDKFIDLYSYEYRREIRKLLLDNVEYYLHPCDAS
jgi:hypothetical protein